MDRYDAVERYYHAIDADEYEELRALLADDFVHDRGDMRLDGADAFVAFMPTPRRATNSRPSTRATPVSPPKGRSDALRVSRCSPSWTRFASKTRSCTR